MVTSEISITYNLFLLNSLLNQKINNYAHETQREPSSNEKIL